MKKSKIDESDLLDPIGPSESLSMGNKEVLYQLIVLYTSGKLHYKRVSTSALETINSYYIEYDYRLVLLYVPTRRQK